MAALYLECKADTKQLRRDKTYPVDASHTNDTLVTLERITNNEYHVRFPTQGGALVLLSIRPL